jgi:hypothetical protein
MPMQCPPLQNVPQFIFQVETNSIEANTITIGVLNRANQKTAVIVTELTAESIQSALNKISGLIGE